MSVVSAPVCVALQMYNFSAEPRLKHDYTILAPTDDAIREHLSKANKTALVGVEVQFNFTSTIPLRT